MKDTNLDELIDAYLKKNISADQRQQLEQYLIADPTIKQQLEESKTAYEYLEYLRYKELRKKLRDADRIHNRIPRKPASKSGWLCAVTILAFLISGITIVKKYQPESVAIRHFEYAAGHSIHTSPQYQLDEAEQLFMAHQYAQASAIYATMPESHAAAWNLIMCELAEKGYKPEMAERLKIISVSGGEKWKLKCGRITTVLQNPIFRCLNPADAAPLPAIKPRIM